MTLRQNLSWFENLVAGDEKWVVYVRKRQWFNRGEPVVTTRGSQLYLKKVMHGVWWGYKGVIHWELLSADTTLTSDVFCRQLNRVEAALRGKQGEIFFLHDNARSHVARETQEKLQFFG